ncbi:NACHT domain-containing protein [Myceligenerans pegani]|uniref:NACHT domain-containing protein n=1 Tax=Myceligenerans pegani TaxID=2776917 RepID=A0ABR9MYU0_9MICO|nr:NACHT domain-containing protein [Myceligenerans sp. TRM 65318]MBE1875947.1 NACHT domain-containing protein [Myceligenerans sp. TRM 65318]MBE3018218.1 NACHT domain-containing protein [Myceligenerans sp. TRM 65318]
MARWRVVFAVGSMLLFVGAGIYFMLDGGLELTEQLASIGSFLLGAITLWFGAFAPVPGKLAPNSEVSILEQLAGVVREQWLEEATRRGLNHPLPLALRWTAADPGLMPSLGAIRGKLPRLWGKGTEHRRLLTGSLAEVSERFLQLPTRRLVVLGEPGAGKTVLAIQLLLELMERRARGTMVPVLLPMASWNPEERGLREWIADQLGEMYPGLNASVAGGGSAAPISLAQALLRDDLVLPILDGLDEVPEHLRAVALQAMNFAFTESRATADPIVVTCRIHEYREIFERTPSSPDAVAAAEEPLAAAAVVEIRPVEREEARRYLLQSTPPQQAAKWEPVFRQIRRDPRGPLARALSSPLMITLARAGYSRTTADTARLLELGQSDRVRIEEHLLDQLVPAVYAGSLGPTGRRSRYDSDRAGRWLAYLARQNARGETRDIAWWNLIDGVPRVARAAIFAVAFGAVIGPVYGLTLALLFALGLDAVGATMIEQHTATAVGLMGGASGGLVYGAVGGLRTPQVPSSARVALRGNVRRILRWSVAGLLAGFTIGFGAGLFGGRLGDIEDGLRSGVIFAIGGTLVFGLVSLFGHPADVSRAVTPGSALRADRMSSLTFEVGVGLGGALTVGFGGGVSAGMGGGIPAIGVGFALALGLSIGTSVGLVVSLVRGRASAWNCFGVARTWLAWRGALPWQVMDFLDDAHRRGVLRQVGAVYQFRHARLQDRLSTRDSPTPAENGGHPGSRRGTISPW